MLPELQDKTLENVNKSLRERAAERIAQELVRYPRLLLNKQGLVDEKVLRSAFDTMQEQSLKDAYRDPDGGLNRFIVFHMGTKELLSLRRHETDAAFFEQCVQFASRDPAYNEQLQGTQAEITKRHFLIGMENFPFKVQELFRHFGNPPRYPGDDQGSWYQAKGRTYPMTVPIFNIHYSAPVPEDSDMLFSECNNLKDIPAKFSRDEIAFLEESAGLVSFVDGLLAYQSRFHVLIAAPFFPYHAIAQRRYGDASEAWFMFLYNDELIDDLKNAKLEPI